jgi:hypothetical protein
MPIITLPDGSQRTYPQALSVAELAADIGPGLAKAALAGRVDSRLVDTAFVLDQDASLSLITARDPEGVEILRHSCAHLLAMAVKQLYPSAQVTIGPVIEDGFFYDFAFERPFTPDDLAQILQGRTDPRHPRRRNAVALPPGRFRRPLSRSTRTKHRQAAGFQADQGGRRLLARRCQECHAAAHLRHLLA